MKGLATGCLLILLFSVPIESVSSAPIPVPRRPSGFDTNNPDTWESNWRENCTNFRYRYDHYSAGPQRTGIGNAVSTFPILGAPIGGAWNTGEDIAISLEREKYAQAATEYGALVAGCDQMEQVIQRQPRPMIQSQPQSRTISFINNCRHPIQVAVQFLNRQEQWQTQAWYQIPSGVRTQLTGIDTRNRSFLFYIEPANGANVDWSGNYSRTIDGRVVGMQLGEFGPNLSNWVKPIACSGR